MDKILDKIKKLLEIILNYLKSIIASVFGFFFDLFSIDKNKKDLKPIKLDDKNINLNNEYSTPDFSVFHSEDDTSRLFTPQNFKITEEIIKKRILFYFLEELEIEEKDLSLKEYDFIEKLNEKIIPIIENYTKENLSLNKDLIETKIKDTLKEQLEEQLAFEKNTPDNKKILTPLILNRDTQTIKITNTPNNTFFKVKRKELLNNNIEPKTSNLNDLVSQSPSPSKSKFEFLNTNENEETFNQNTAFVPPKSDIGNYSNEAVKVKNIENTNEDTFFFDTNNEVKELENIIIANEEVLEKPESFIEPEVFKDEGLNVKTLSEEENIEILDEALEFDNYDFTTIDNIINDIIHQYKEEVKKEELEDKDYESIENKINSLLNEINKLKLKNLSPMIKNQLIAKENDLLQLKNDLSMQKQKDICNEEASLDAGILNEDLDALEKELEKLHLDDKIDLQKFMLNNLEELDNLTLDKIKLIEKELLKIKLRKAIHALEVSSLLALPFIRNKYFMFFTGSLFANRHLKFFDAILKRKTLEYEASDLESIKTGSSAFQNAMFMSKQNIEYLEYLEMEAFKKYPELRFDANYILTLNNLKTKLLIQQEKLTKKEKMIQKHNLKLKNKIRKLIKKENQNF